MFDKEAFESMYCKSLNFSVPFVLRFLRGKRTEKLEFKEHH